ncbi:MULTISPECIES: ribbon-helix-helix domain-containing protein [Cyanophyceae]|uniref:ribbon-helix-helix domain-containing protein n=1 Tax=Cyanophyceae TaxID=3028117 RepID=UPI0018EF7BBB|nr:ribbon-helix-helix protein, CopG family [Trichocoleus sp. FACHB-69]
MIYDMAKVTVTLYMDEEDKEALQQLADAEERSLSQMAVLILKRAIRQAQEEGKILPSQSKRDK